MCKNNFKCERCMQTSFVEMEKQPCEHCRRLAVDDFMIAIETGEVQDIVIVLHPHDTQGMDDREIIYVPFYSVIDYWEYDDDDEATPESIIKDIKEKISEEYDCDYGVKFEFQHLASAEKLGIDITKPVHRCDETGIDFYEESPGHNTGEFYSTPWDTEPEDNNFCCCLAVDCYEGRWYSKDFAYFHCEDCNRYVCEQNPANGYMSQFRRVGDCEQVCLKCLQETILKAGIHAVDYRDDDQIFPMFFSHDELSENNYEEFYDWEVGMQYRGVGKDSEEDLIDAVNILGEDLEIAVAVDIGMLGHGGGGFGTIYVKTDKYSIDDIHKKYAAKLIELNEEENEEVH